jgi:site-specific DNA-methyltransferase (adenine-specific)
MSLPTPYYERNGIKIFHGDCREILPSLGRFDLLLADPPYLLPGMKGAGCFGGRASLTGTQGFTDMGFDASILEESPNWFCFCSKHNLTDVIAKASSGKWAILHWCKTNPVPTCNNTYLSDVEYCVHRWSKGRLFGEMNIKSLFELRPVGQKDTSHPNEKPLNFIRRLVRLGSLPGDSILDPFMGSGTTLLAAKLEGRQAVGIELEERYCEIAAQRLAQGVFEFEESPR